MTTIPWYANVRDRSWTCAAPSREAMAFHRNMPVYAVTSLVELPEVASELGVAHVYAKAELSRLGLPAFKALGASWAVHRALGDRASEEPGLVVTATDGNHGRAVARFARLQGQRVHIYIPQGVSEHSINNIRNEGAEVTIIDGSYDDAVATAARVAADQGAVLVQDTAWEGYETIPGWIVEGYETIFAEIDGQLADVGIDHASLVVVPTGVGSLLQAALAHYRCQPTATAVMSAEAHAGACVAPSLIAGRPVTVETGTTVMAGLNCGTPSSLAWPYIEHGLDAAVAVSDDDDIRAAHDLAAMGVPAGPCGASSLAALRVALLGEGSIERRRHLGIDADSTIILIVTEGSDATPLPDLPQA